MEGKIELEELLVLNSMSDDQRAFLDAALARQKRDHAKQLARVERQYALLRAKSKCVAVANELSDIAMSAAFSAFIGACLWPVWGTLLLISLMLLESLGLGFF